MSINRVLSTGSGYTSHAEGGDGIPGLEPLEIDETACTRTTNEYRYERLRLPHWSNYHLTRRRRYSVLEQTFRARQWLRNNWIAWKAGLTCNILLTISILITNIAIPSFAARKYGADGGYLYRGDCNKAKRVGLVAHGLINALGTLLLSASNYTMQILSSPTREDIDHAHSRGETMAIGIPSFTNLRFVGKYRRILWLALALSSIPLHLIYNSLVFLTTGKYSYLAAVVLPEFLDGAAFNSSFFNDPVASSSKNLFDTGSIPLGNGDWFKDYSFAPYNAYPESEVIGNLREKARTDHLEELTVQDCMNTYLHDTSVRYRNFLAVSDDAISKTSSAIWIDIILANRDEADDYFDWTCKNSYNTTFNWGFRGRPTCGPVTDSSMASNWSIGLYVQPFKGSPRMGSHRVSRCLAEPVPLSPCSLRYDWRLLLVVVAANIVKLSAMIATLCQYKRQSFVTVGDGLASFLSSPDPYTRGMCLAKEEDFTRDPWPVEPRSYFQINVKSSRSAGASYRQWVVTMALSALSIAATMIAFVKVYQPVSFQWSFTGYVDPGSIRFGQGLNVGALIVIANIPQLLVSFNYIFINRLVSCMAASREWSLYAHQRKGLRTSTPAGAQRSTFWLQLPMKFSVPLMVLSAGLHYLVSQSLYFGSFQFYELYDDANGAPIISEDITGLGYSHDAAYILTIVLIISIAGAVSWGRLQNKPGIPPSRFCSAAISAACHPPDREEDVHLKPVQWGEVKWGSTATEVGHCTFSSDEVIMPVEGREYM